MFFMVSVKNTWTNQPVTLEEIKLRGFEVVPSRRSGDFQMFLNGIMCGWLFRDQAEQIAFLRSKGLI